MRRNDGSKNKSSNIVLKIGVTYIIPIFLAICGATIIFTDVWKQIFKRCYFYDNYSNNDIVANDTNSLQINDKRIFVPTAGSNFATINIPAIDLNEDIYQGSYNEIMILGIGHYSYSGLPGFNRNCILRGLNNNQFMQLNKLKNGDQVTISTDYGCYYYEVSEIKIYQKDDNSFLDSYPREEKLTMYTDYPFGDISTDNGQKYVVTCNYIKCEY